MEFSSLDPRNFKKIFFQFFLINLISVIASYIVVKEGLFVAPLYSLGKQMIRPSMYTIAVLAIFYTQWQKKQVARLATFENFEERVVEYEKVYKYRLYWYLFACLVACVLFLLTAINVFFIFGILDVLMLLPYYPNKLLFKKDLKNNELVFIEK